MARVVGEVELVSGSAEVTLAGTCFVPTLRIGNRVLRNSCTEPSLYHLLEPGEEVTLYCGRVLWWRWILGVGSRGARHRHGIFTFLLGNGVHGWVAGIAASMLWALVFGGASSTQEAFAWLGGLAALARNIKVWLT